MIRIIAATLMMLFVFQSPFAARAHSQSTSGRTDRDYDRLVGPVRSVRTETERQSNTKGSIRALDKIVVYDKSGWLTDSLSFGLDNCVRSRTRIEYCNAGSRAERVFWGTGVLQGEGDESSQPKKPVKVIGTITFNFTL